MLMVACGGSSHPDSPAIHAFKAEPARAAMGQEVVLFGTYSRGHGVVDPAVGPLASGEPLKVFPKATTTYVLRVMDGQGRTVTASTRVEVGPGLAVDIQGSEGGVGAVRVEGPGGFSRTLTTSAVLPEIEPGEYTITAEPTGSGSTQMLPLVSAQKVQVTTGTEVTVQYLSPTLTVYLDEAVPLEMVLIKPGTFTMGSNEGDPRYYPAHRPPHPVTIPRPFYAAKYPTTQAQWQAVMGDNPSTLKNPDFPVTNVSFDDIQDGFLPKLNKKVSGHGFRLPSEAEWEYACRAGTSTDSFFDQDERLQDYAWTYDRNGSYLHPVGQKKPNPWGLYDLSGLVFQWCQDLTHHGYEGAPSDGTAWLTPDRDPLERIVRGHGPHYYPPMEGKSFQRSYFYAAVREDFLGFRLLYNGDTSQLSTQVQAGN
ncbi:MAG: SUMF1/EgtB/PvdO family nonheme iron enzyme [Holophaga sp.]|nr:SUMF1/EgtB/PvdO family nonheme iron enzyme [Holophaga sp.]